MMPRRRDVHCCSRGLDREYALLDALANTQVDPARSLLDILLHAIAASHLPGLGRLGVCSRQMKQLLKQQLLHEQRRALLATDWGESVLFRASKTLVLKSKGINDTTLTLLTQVLHNMQPMRTLHVLNLYGNSIGDAGMAAIATAMSTRTLAGLRSLRLSDNAIGNAGMVNFGLAASNGPLALTALALNHNEIGDAGICALADIIFGRSLRKLSTLALAYNKIGDAGMTRFSSVISRGLPALKVLHLNMNRSSVSGTMALANAIAHGSLPSLQSLYMDGGDELTAACGKRSIRHFTCTTLNPHNHLQRQGGEG